MLFDTKSDQCLSIVTRRVSSAPHVQSGGHGPLHAVKRQCRSWIGMLMKWLAHRNPIRSYYLVWFGCLILVSPAQSNTPSSGKDQHRAVSNVSTTSPSLAWEASPHKRYRDFVLLFVPDWLGVAGAAALAIYYDNERPYPTTCHPPKIDKWQHCYVGCSIATWCPLGSFSASILAILKEIRDTIHYGVFSWADVYATLRGAWHCTGYASCEACCCEKLGELGVGYNKTGGR